jgi:hypothetical protein
MSLIPISAIFLTVRNIINSMLSLKLEYFSLSNINLLVKNLFIRESSKNKLTMTSFNEKPCSVKDDLPKIGNVVNKNHETVETLSNATYKPQKSGKSSHGLSSKSPESSHDVRGRSRNSVNKHSSIKSEFGYDMSGKSEKSLRFVVDTIKTDGREILFKTPSVSQGSFMNDSSSNGRNENIVRAPYAPRPSALSTPSTMSPLFPNNN